MAGILSLQTKKYAIKIENFEGPLDLLCHLIDKNKMDIYDININEITEQYIEYLNEMEELNLEITSEFLVMASTLLYIKSRNLIPRQDDEEEEELTEEELIKQIIEYKKYKEISNKIRENYNIYSKRFFSKAENITLPNQEIEEDYPEGIISDVYEKLVKRNSDKINKNAKNIEKIAITDTYTVHNKVKEIFKALIKKKKIVFNKMFSTKEKDKQEVVTAFTGLLELSRRSKVTTTQKEQFGDIIVEKKKAG